LNNKGDIKSRPVAPTHPAWYNYTNNKNGYQNSCLKMLSNHKTNIDTEMRKYPSSTAVATSELVPNQSSYVSTDYIFRTNYPPSRHTTSGVELQSPTYKLLFSEPKQSGSTCPWVGRLTQGSDGEQRN